MVDVVQLSFRLVLENYLARFRDFRHTWDRYKKRYQDDLKQKELCRKVRSRSVKYAFSVKICQKYDFSSGSRKIRSRSVKYAFPVKICQKYDFSSGSHRPQ